MENTTIELKLDERTTRAIHQAVCFTLDRWSGQGDMDQETLLYIKPKLQACVFEFDFGQPFG